MKKRPVEVHNSGLCPRGYDAMSFCVWIFFAKHLKYASPRLIQHETIHYRQQCEMLFLFQWLWYLLEFVVRFIMYLPFRNPKAINKSVFWQIWEKAYYNVSFEREAYANGGVENYLKTRPRWAWVKFLRKK